MSPKEGLSVFGNVMPILCIGGLGTAWMVILLYIILSIVTHICEGKTSKTADK